MQSRKLWRLAAHSGRVRPFGKDVWQRIGLLAVWAVSLLVLMPVSAFAQASGSGTGSIEGRVLNVGNNRYLNNARITVDGTNLETYTNEFGSFRLNNVPAGTATVRATYTGLDPKVSTVTVNAGQINRLEIEMTSTTRYGAEKAVVLDPFVVTSQREYEGDALATNEQRYAPNLKVVMASDSFGTINEGNPGEFLKYLPGVTVDYVAADVRTVSVRGFSGTFTNVYWDGMRLTSSASGSSNRLFEFEQVSINNTSRTEITKLPIPELPSDSLGGTVNFVSKNAFERKGAQFNYRLYLNVNSENVTLSKTPGPPSANQRKVLPSFDFDYTLPVNDKFGLVITGLSSNQFVEQHRWQPTWNFAQAGATPTNPYLQRWQLQDGPKTTQRASVGVKADWKITDNSVASFAFQDNFYHSFFGNRNVNFNIGTSSSSTPSGHFGLDYGTDYVNSAYGRASVTQGSSFRDKYGNTFATKASYKFDNGDWTVDAGASYVKSRTWYRALGRGHFSNVGTTLQNVKQVRVSGINRDTLGWAAYDGSGNELDPLDLNNYRLNTLRDDPVDGLALMKEIRADVGRSFDVGFPLKVKVGFDIRKETRDNIRQRNDYTYLGPDGVANTADDHAGAYLDTVYRNVDPGWGYQPIEWINAYALADALATNPSWFRLGTGSASSNPDGVQAETYRRQNSERISERVDAGYLQFEGHGFNNRLGWVAGVRYEKTTDDGEGQLNQPDAIWQTNADGSFVDGDPNTAGVQRVRKPEAGANNSMDQLNLTLIERGYKTSRSYDDFYPSLNLVYNLTRDWVLRFGYAKTFGRPDYVNIIPATTINGDDDDPINNPGTITIRNTGLKPWTAQNYDLSLEYYPEKGGLISAGVFSKSLSDFWENRGGTVDAALASELGLDPAYIGWGVSTTVNGGDAKIEGVEFNLIKPLDFLPGWGKYFTIKLNGTKLNLSGEKSTDFRGFIKQTGNFNIGFNKKPFSANITFNYRGRQIGSSPTANPFQTGSGYGATNGFVEYYAPRTFVDVSGEVKITKNMSIFAGVRNLFNKQQVLQRYNDVTPDYAKNYRFEEFGVSCSVGIKGSW